VNNLGFIRLFSLFEITPIDDTHPEIRWDLLAGKVRLLRWMLKFGGFLEFHGVVLKKLRRRLAGRFFPIVTGCCPVGFESPYGIHFPGTRHQDA